MAELNEGALKDPRVTVHSEDAMGFLEQSLEQGAETWDVIIMDLPDPSEDILGSLYADTFFELCAKRLSSGGALITQATSPFKTRDAFWTIVRTLQAARWEEDSGEQNFTVHPYRTYVPSFGAWGFVLAGKRPLQPAALKIDVKTKYLTSEMLPGLFNFPLDIGPRGSGITTVDALRVVAHFQDGYSERFRA